MSALNFLNPDAQLKRYRAKVKHNEAKKAASKAEGKTCIKGNNAIKLMNERLKIKN